MLQTQDASPLTARTNNHTLFLEVVLSLIVKGRLPLDTTWEPFFFWTAINADFQGELWFLNPLCEKRETNVISAADKMAIQCYKKKKTVHVQTLIRDGIESVTNSGQNTL